MKKQFLLFTLILSSLFAFSQADEEIDGTLTVKRIKKDNTKQRMVAVDETTGLFYYVDRSIISGGGGGGTDDQIASEVPFSPTGNTSSTDLQTALVELQVDIDGISDTDDQEAVEVFVNTNVLDGIFNSSDDNVQKIVEKLDNITATLIPTTPYLTLLSVNLQAVIQELKDELDVVTANVVHKTGTETITGPKTFSQNITAPTYNNVAIGRVGTGYFIGLGSGDNNTGNSVLGFGIYSLTDNTGDFVTSIGFNAMQYNTGDSSIGIGYASLGSNNGDNINGIGDRTLRYNNGDNNNAFGNASLRYTSSTANNLSAFGHNSSMGSSLTPLNFNNSTSIGANSDITKNNQVTLGDSNTVEILTSGVYKSTSYGSGSVGGTPTYNISVDVNGNFIETPVSSGFVPTDLDTDYDFTDNSTNWNTVFSEWGGELKSNYLQNTVLDDNTFATATNTSLSSSESIKGYVDLKTTGYTATTILADFTLALADKDKLILNTGTSDYVVTIPLNSTTSIPIDTTYPLVKTSSGVFKIEAESGVTFPSIQSNSAYSYNSFSLRKIATDTWIVLGNGGYVSYTPPSSNLLLGNSANPDNEVDGVAGFTAGQGVGTTYTSITTAPQNGTYCVEVSQATGAIVSRRDYSFTSIIGEVYTVSYYVKDSGGEGYQRHGAWTGCDNGGGSYDTPPSLLNPTTSWVQHTYTVQATAITMTFKFYAYSSNEGTGGDSIYIDNFTIIQQ